MKVSPPRSKPRGAVRHRDAPTVDQVEGALSAVAQDVKEDTWRCLAAVMALGDVVVAADADGNAAIDAKDAGIARDRVLFSLSLSLFSRHSFLDHDKGLTESVLRSRLDQDVCVGPHRWCVFSRKETQVS